MPEPKLSIVPCGDYTPETVRAALLAALDAVGGLDWVKPGMRIGIKLNLCAARKPEQAATTHPVMAAELTRLLRERGAEVVLGDSPGEPFTSVVLSRVYSLGDYALCEAAGGELNRDFSHHTVEFPDAVTVKSFEYSAWLEKCDAVINFSKLKAHGLMGMTAAVKNLYGVIPGTVKSEYHFRYPDPTAFANMLVDLNEYVRPVLCLCDAVDIMEGNGPTAGTPRHIGVIAAAKTPYAADLLAARLIGLDGSAPTIAAAAERGLCPGSFDGLSVYGDVAAMAVADFKKQPPRGEMRLNSKIPAIRHIASLCFGTGPRVNAEKCVGCGKCQSVCPMHTVHVKDGKARISREACIRCFCCQEFCPQGAITLYRPPLARLMGKL